MTNRGPRNTQRTGRKLGPALRHAWPVSDVPRKTHGFTLIELVITIAVLGTLSAVAFPAFRAMIAGERIRTASFDTMSALTVARSEAVKRNAQVSLSPVGGNWRNGWTVSVGSSVLRRQSALSSSLSVTCYSGSAASPCLPISYTGSGRLSPGTAMPSIFISSNATTGAFVRCISIDPSGRPRSAKASCV